MSTDDRNRSIVKAIIAMAHKFSMKTVAQGVETAEQRDLLIAEGIDHLAKGYFFAKHMPPREFIVHIGKDSLLG